MIQDTDNLNNEIFDLGSTLNEITDAMNQLSHDVTNLQEDIDIEDEDFENTLNQMLGNVDIINPSNILQKSKHLQSNITQPKKKTQIDEEHQLLQLEESMTSFSTIMHNRSDRKTGSNLIQPTYN
jgi:hypothetical protein